jgi:apolipoprotein N-acyltransferase
LLAVVSAVLFALAYPPYDLRLLGWVCLAPLFVALRLARSLGVALAAMFVWSIAMSVGITDWLVGGVSTYYAQPLWVGVAMLAGTTFFGATIDYLFFAIAYRPLARAYPRTACLWAGAVWVASELGRSRIGPGNPWGLLGYSQAALAGGGETSGLLAYAPLALIQIGDVLGVYGVSFVLVCVNAALAEALLAVRNGDSRRGAATQGIVALATLGAVLLYGRTRIDAFEATSATSKTVGIVQGNLDLGTQWREDLYGANLDAYLALTREALARTPRPELVIWPENVMTFFVDDERTYRDLIANVLRPHDAQLLAGAPHYEGAVDTRYFNSAFLIAPSGDITARYDKLRLLPFAEYFPLGRLEALQRRFARVRFFTPGKSAAPLPTPIGRAGVLICNEAMYPEEARTRTLAGAEVLVNLSNDTWIPDPEFGEHVFHMAAMRAVEQRRWLVRASTSGPSAFVDPLGVVRARTGLLSRAVLFGDVSPRTELTLYARYGDWFAWACVVAVAAALLARATTRLSDET